MRRTPQEYLIGLHRIAAMTPRRMLGLLDRFVSPEEVWRAPASALRAVSEVSSAAEAIAVGRSEEALDRDLACLRRLKGRAITLLDPEYPALLRSLEVPPAVLFVIGKADIDVRRTIGIVGTRRSSRYGRAVAHALAADLAARGVVIVSGLAAGIDTCAHLGALDGSGHTVAVLGAGLLHPYPAENRGLFDRVSEAGTLLSPFPLDLRPARWTFPARNVVLAGLCRGVVVVEAPERSGALLTARAALDQGREVVAVPGNITSRGSAGTNRLIQDGAALVTSAEEILSLFPGLGARVPQLGGPVGESALSLSGVERRVLHAVGLEPVQIDDIIARLGLTPAEAATALFSLELAGLIQEEEGKRYTRRL